MVFHRSAIMSPVDSHYIFTIISPLIIELVVSVRHSQPGFSERKIKMSSGGLRRIDIDEFGDVTIAKFIDNKILDETNIQIIGNQLFALVEQDGRKKIILDFTNVEYLSSAALGKLITLEKKVKAARGKLRLCSIRPEIYEVFAITKLDQIFTICDDSDEALQSF